MEPIVINYRFKFDDAEVKEYQISLDSETITYLSKGEDKPDWTKLEFHQCENCPLDPATSPYCPIAANLSDFVEHFKNEISYKEALMIVYSENRYYAKRVALQDGLYSVYGLIMSTSNCPYMNFFKPMARFHLPFASMEETVFRAVSSYLLEQYFAHRKGKEIDLDLTGLLDRYVEVAKVNEGISARLRAVTTGDADRNAVSLLDTLAQIMHFEIGGSLESLEYLYSTIFSPRNHLNKVQE